MASTETVIDRRAVQEAVEGSRRVLNDLPRQNLSDEMALLVKAACLHIASNGEGLLKMTAQMGKAPPRFAQWSDSKLDGFLVQTELLQDELRRQHASTERLADLPVPQIRALIRALGDALTSLFSALEVHLQAAKEHQADRDVAAGRVRTFPSAAEAVAFLQSLPPEPQ